jgi:uncharacterized protein
MSNAQIEAGSIPIERQLAEELKLTPAQIWSAIKLLDSGATVPFIARYRKEATGGLTDTHLRQLSERLEYVRDLEERKTHILQTIGDQGKLTPGLQAQIQAAATKTILEDIYLPFKPKKNSKSQAARDSGLEPLADLLISEAPDPQTAARAFVNPEKNVPDAATALLGARDILIERFAEDAELVGELRERFRQSGLVITRRKDIEKLKLLKPEDVAKFTDYFDYKEPIVKIPSHRVLAILRGRQEKVLDAELIPDQMALYSGNPAAGEEGFAQSVMSRFGIGPARRPAENWLMDAARFAWKYKIRMRIELDLWTSLRESAEADAIKVFADNLRSLLLAAPAGPRVTLGLDPGFRTGVKWAVVDRTGKVLGTGAIYPHPPQDEWGLAMKAIAMICEKHAVELIAIGNGTASRETDKLVLETLKANPKIKAQKLIVSEAGASVYSASELASGELPGLDVTVRGAVSIARRLQDPLAELVKIDPKSIGVGQYQHDVNQARLAKTLGAVVEDCVNAVGVDVNTASPSLLSFVSGLSQRVAKALVDWRDKAGAFKDRRDFMKIPDFGPRAFEQAAGFLRIRGGSNPLDASGVHPESYPVVERMLADAAVPVDKLLGNAQALTALKPETYTDEKFGLPTVRDILAEMEKPGRDPRPEFKTAVLRDDVTRMEDLKPGMILEGTITNVAAFGCFIDIGVHQDGLAHVSELANFFIKDPREVVRAGMVVKARVLEVDIARKRISLSLRSQSQASSQRPSPKK